MDIQILINPEITEEFKTIEKALLKVISKEDNLEIIIKSGPRSKSTRAITKIINQYAVTQLPFVLISENEIGVSAVYSEEMPITLERITQKINETLN